MPWTCNSITRAMRPGSAVVERWSTASVMTAQPIERVCRRNLDPRLPRFHASLMPTPTSLIRYGRQARVGAARRRVEPSVAPADNLDPSCSIVFAPVSVPWRSCASPYGFPISNPDTVSVVRSGRRHQHDPGDPAAREIASGSICSDRTDRAGDHPRFPVNAERSGASGGLKEWNVPCEHGTICMGCKWKLCQLCVWCAEESLSSDATKGSWKPNAACGKPKSKSRCDALLRTMALTPASSRSPEHGNSIAMMATRQIASRRRCQRCEIAN
jgi:hypothetical protein